MKEQLSLFNEGDLVLQSTVSLHRHLLTNVDSNKLLLKLIGPFHVLRRLSKAYTIELTCKMHTYPTFYVGLLRPYYQYGASSGESSPCAQASPTDTCARDVGSQPTPVVPISPHEDKRYPDDIPSSRREENAILSH